MTTPTRKKPTEDLKKSSRKKTQKAQKRETILHSLYRGRIHQCRGGLAILFLRSLHVFVATFFIFQVFRWKASNSGSMDLFNAVTALVHHRAMVTHNVADYAIIPGLTNDDSQAP